jgi:hypothetical protein
VDKQSNRATGFVVVSLDESFFSFMILSDKKGFWIVEENKRPIVRITGSHKHSCIVGAISMEENQLFRHSIYDVFNGDALLHDSTFPNAFS